MKQLMEKRVKEGRMNDMYGMCTRKNGWVDEMDGWMDSWMDGQMDRQMEGWMDGLREDGCCKGRVFVEETYVHIKILK